MEYLYLLFSELGQLQSTPFLTRCDDRQYQADVLLLILQNRMQYL